MRNYFIAISIFTLAAFLGSQAWSGQYDGKWTGTYKHNKCWNAEILLFVEGHTVSGQIKYVKQVLGRSTLNADTIGTLRGEIDDTGKLRVRSSELKSNWGPWKVFLGGTITGKSASINYYNVGIVLFRFMNSINVIATKLGEHNLRIHEVLCTT